MDSGGFDPAFDLSSRSREELATLGREYLLAGHLQDRATMPQVIARYGADDMTAVAIDEWMGASPVYTRRMQQALAFEGDDVATIFKGIQLDIGAPPQFMDFRFRVDDEHHGEFWLDCCGALMDVEPMGESFVKAMCHDIEDPTFDATAVATNPRARMRPIHRPPREPAGREPHCRWRVIIDPSADPLTETDRCRQVATSNAATLPLSQPSGGGGEGLGDYSGPFEPDLQLEDFSPPALVTILDEACLQGHLLVHSLMLTLADRYGDAVAREIASGQFRGVAPVVAQRVARAMGIEGGGIAAVARMLQLHPAFRPRAYVAMTMTLDGDRLHLGLKPCPGLDENGGLSWPVLLAADPALITPVAQAVDPRAVVEPTTPRSGERVAWEITINPGAPPASEPDEVALTRFSTGADFVFIRRPSAIA